MKPSSPPRAVRTGRGRTWLWIVVALAALLLLTVLSPVIAVVSLIVLITAIVALAKRTPTWLRLRSRGAAIGVVAGAATILLVSGSVSAAMLPHGDAPVAAPGRASDRAGVAFTGGSDGDAAATSGSVVDDPSADSAGGMSALDLLATLPVKGRAPMTGYERDEFGQRWLDVDRNGCDTRNDILARDLFDATTSGPCTVVAGVLDDPYTAVEVDFERGADTSSLVQIDHVVALGDAWQKGAQQLTADARASLANDPVNLLAVSQRANLQKRDGDAATWLPANKAFRCEYVARQISVKAAYGLWVTQAEHDAMARVLAGCPGQEAFASELAAAVLAEPVASADADARVDPATGRSAEPAPEKPAPAKPKPEPAQPSISYANCAAARAAGAAPLHRNDPGYSAKLDRDGDGIACE